MKSDPTSESENELQQWIMAIGAGLKCILTRNNVGGAEIVKGKYRSFVRFGLFNSSEQENDRIKSSDLIGIKTVVITPDMVGQRIGVFTAVEVKEPGWKFTGTKREIAQKAFIDFVNNAGGRAGFAQSLDDARAIIGP